MSYLLGVRRRLAGGGPKRSERGGKTTAKPLFGSGLPVVLLIWAAFGATLAACSDDGASSEALTIDVVLSSTETVLHQAGIEDEAIYGWNRLTGTADVGGEPVEVELLGSVDYRNGGGDFFGFVTFRFSDGSSFGVRLLDGRTEAATDTSDASFASSFEVIDGAGIYAGVSGDGDFEGTRNDALGGAVEAQFRVDLKLP